MTNFLRLSLALALVCWTPVSPFAQSLAQPAQEFITLEDASERFLRRNLELEAARLEVGVAEAERIAARLRPRPGLTISAENLRLSGETPANRLQEFGGTVAQPIELGKRQARRMDLANRTVGVAEARLTDVL